MYGPMILGIGVKGGGSNIMATIRVYKIDISSSVIVISRMSLTKPLPPPFVLAVRLV